MADKVKEHAAKKDNHGIVNSIFDGIKSMTNKALSFMGHKDLQEQDARKSKKMQNLILTDNAVLVPIQSKSGTALIVLDKGTDTAKAVLDGIFNVAHTAIDTAKNIHKSDKGTAIADKVLDGVKKAANHGISTAEQVKNIQKGKHTEMLEARGHAHPSDVQASAQKKLVELAKAVQKKKLLELMEQEDDMPELDELDFDALYYGY